MPYLLGLNVVGGSTPVAIFRLTLRVLAFLFVAGIAKGQVIPGGSGDVHCGVFAAMQHSRLAVWHGVRATSVSPFAVANFRTPRLLVHMPLYAVPLRTNDHFLNGERGFALRVIHADGKPVLA
jgi:hypothetical protein